MIKQRIVYTYDSKDFESLAKLKDYVENKIGTNIIDMMDDLLNQKLTPKQKLKILQVLTHQTARRQLIELLNVTYIDTDLEIDSSGIYQGEKQVKRNILDLKP